MKPRKIKLKTGTEILLGRNAEGNDKLVKKFKGKSDELLAAAERLGGDDRTDEIRSADLAFLFRPLPRILVMLMFWDEDLDDDFDAEVKLLFDESILDHLDIESIMFLSERLTQLLCEDECSN